MRQLPMQPHCFSIDSTSAMAYWHRAVCQMAMSGFKASNGVDVKLQEAGALSDLNKAIALKPQKRLFVLL